MMNFPFQKQASTLLNKITFSFRIVGIKSMNLVQLDVNNYFCIGLTDCQRKQIASSIATVSEIRESSVIVSLATIIKGKSD